MTNETGTTGAAGWLAYDGQCGFCTRWAHRVEGILRRRHIGLVTLDTSWVRERLGLGEGEAADRMWLLLPDGRSLGGADAAIEIGRRVWWAKPLAWIAGLPGIRGLMQRAYMMIARRRRCEGACAVLGARGAGGAEAQAGGAKPQAASSARRRGSPGEPATYVAAVIDVLPLFALPAAALIWARALPAWGFMWTLTLAIFAGFKWVMFRRGVRSFTPPPPAGRQLAFLLLWPGMNSRSFLDTQKQGHPPKLREWRTAIGNTLLGAALVWIGVRFTPVDLPIVAGWVGMVGLSFLVHFGFFRVLEMIWRSRGVAATPMMLMPAGASSLGDFWGRRWNKDFNVLAQELIFEPLHRRLSATKAMVLVFILSGLIHDLVVSVPSRGGYGLPTAYFLLQAAGLWFERTLTGRRLGLGRGLRGWLFAAVITLTAVFLLFHPPFVLEVILPFLDAIGAV